MNTSTVLNLKRQAYRDLLDRGRTNLQDWGNLLQSDPFGGIYNTRDHLLHLQNINKFKVIYGFI